MNTWFALIITAALADGVTEEERLGFFPEVEIVYCECAIDVVLKGDRRDLTFGDKSGTIKFIINFYKK